MIKFFRHSEIDRKQWDKCIQHSLCGHIYGMSWYLDLVAPGWGALVKDQYRAVMPLPIRSKFGIYYVFQPLFAQQLGVYSSENTDPDLLLEFILAIPPFIRYIDTNLNFSNEIGNLQYNFREQLNYELVLDLPYENLQKKYTLNTRRNIGKSLKYNKIVDDVEIKDFIHLKKKNPTHNSSATYYKWLSNMIKNIQQKKLGFIPGARIDKQLEAAALFLKHKHRIYYLIAVSGEKAKASRAMFGVMDHVLKKYAGSGKVLDFEGSNIPGIARFFEGFGASSCKYYKLNINRLPLWLRIFKK